LRGQGPAEEGRQVRCQRRSKAVWQRHPQNSIYNFKQPDFRILATPMSPRFALVSPANEGRRNAERRTLVTAAACFPDCRKTEAHGNASQRPAAATSSSLGPDFRAQARASSPSRQVSPPFTCLVQPLKAAPRSGHGRLPKAPRVCGCKPQPQAPHRPSGCPSGQLSLCPTSECPREAPFTEQDARIISARGRAGIGIQSQVRERREKYRRHPEALAAKRRASKDGHRRWCSLRSFEARCARTSG
jgi:hypothetical protein